MALINAEEMYNRYVEDVIRRNDALIKLQKESLELFEGKSTVEMLPLLENIFKQENEYRAPKTEKEKEDAKKRVPTEDNDFKVFCENIHVNIIYNNFRNRSEFFAVKEEIDNAPNMETKRKIVNSLYSHFSKEIAEQKLEDKYIRKNLVSKTIERMHRRIIGDSFFGETNGFADKGNCTKGITVSLLKMEQEYGLSLFSEKTNNENLAQPEDLAKELEQYAKTSASGNLRDIENIRKGDIVMLFDGKGKPQHAMMVSGVDEQGNPLLLGFTATQRNLPMFERKADEKPRKGIVIDVHAFITDKVQAHNSQELAQMAFKQKTQSVR